MSVTSLIYTASYSRKPESQTVLISTVGIAMHSFLTAEKRKEPVHEILIRSSHVVLNSLQRPFCCTLPVLDSILFSQERLLQY
jgi:hypothetical protein